MSGFAIKSNKRKPATFSFFKANFECAKAVHAQGFGCCPPCGCNASNTDAFPAKMKSPGIEAGMEKRGIGSGGRIRCGLARSFAKRASDACQCEVFRRSRATSRLRNDVINVKAGFLGRLREQAILATVSCTLNDQLAQMVSNGHPFTRLVCEGAPNGGEAAKSGHSSRPTLRPRDARRRSTIARSLACPTTDVAGVQPPWAVASDPDHQASQFQIGLFATYSPFVCRANLAENSACVQAQNYSTVSLCG